MSCQKNEIVKLKKLIQDNLYICTSKTKKMLAGFVKQQTSYIFKSLIIK